MIVSVVSKNLGQGLTLFPRFIQARNLATSAILKQAHELVPKLAVLENLKTQAISSGVLPNLTNTYVIGVQHLVETTGSLFKAMIELGVLPENMFFTGKCYSTNIAVTAAIQKMGVNLIPGSVPSQLGKYHPTHMADVQHMWAICQQKLGRAKKIDGIIILDDGASTMQVTPSPLIRNHPVLAIEQTRAGIYENMQEYLPVINVAQSAAKRYLESELIQKKVIAQMQRYLEGINKNSSIIGVAGYGFIGKALANQLAHEGYQVSIYDDNKSVYPASLPTNVRIASTLPQLFFDSHFIFGCTGRDITESIKLLEINNHNRTLISCSSGDTEFNSLLASIAQTNRIIEVNPLQDVKCINFKGSKISIVNGGFPANFDRQSISVPNNQIALTRGLLLSAFIQAAWLISKHSSEEIRGMGNIMLSPELQQHVIQTWQETLDPKLQAALPFSSVQTHDLIKKNSEGKDLSQALVKNLQPCPPATPFPIQLRN